MVVSSAVSVAAAISSITCIRIMMVQGSGGGYPSKSMELRWINSTSRRKNLIPNPNSGDFGSLKSKPKPPPLMMPIYVSTDPSHVNLQGLSELYSRCNHSCHRFPEVDPKTGIVEESMDLDKLRMALSHSCVVVSVFCKPQHVSVNQIRNQEEQKKKTNKGLFEDLVESVMPVVTPSDGQLVGFGRAVSDLGLTASIYDVMVAPPLQGMGIGTIIVKRIVRMLTSRDIYDIAALCSRKERFFFKACGFKDDLLGSTTMMYTRTVSNSFEGDEMVRKAGRKLLLAPPLKGPFSSSSTTKRQS